MSYMVEKGDTISKVTDLMKVSWAELKRVNPHAVGRSSRTGNWFLKQGAIVTGKDSFEAILEQAQKPAVENSVVKMAASEPSPEKTSQQDAQEWREYTIKRGDTLWALAVKKFHVNVNDLIETSYQRALDLLSKNRDGLEQLAKLLIDQEVIYSDDLEKIFGKQEFGQTRLEEIEELNKIRKEKLSKKLEEEKLTESKKSEEKKSEEKEIEEKKEIEEAKEDIPNPENLTALDKLKQRIEKKMKKMMEDMEKNKKK